VEVRKEEEKLGKVREAQKRCGSGQKPESSPEGKRIESTRVFLGTLWIYEHGFATHDNSTA
jgi:hypothetical protein